MQDSQLSGTAKVVSKGGIMAADTQMVLVSGNVLLRGFYRLKTLFTGSGMLVVCNAGLAAQP